MEATNKTLYLRGDKVKFVSIRQEGEKENLYNWNEFSEAFFANQFKDVKSLKKIAMKKLNLVEIKKKKYIREIDILRILNLSDYILERDYLKDQILSSDPNMKELIFLKSFELLAKEEKTGQSDRLMLKTIDEKIQQLLHGFEDYDVEKEKNKILEDGIKLSLQRKQRRVLKHNQIMFNAVNSCNIFSNKINYTSTGSSLLSAIKKVTKERIAKRMLADTTTCKTLREKTAVRTKEYNKQVLKNILPYDESRV